MLYTFNNTHKNETYTICLEVIKMKMKRFIGAVAAMAVAGTLTVGAAAETYNAYIGFQTAPYSFRNSFDDATYGKDVADGKYFNSVIVWGGNDPETFPQYEDKFDDDMPGGQAGYVLPATYTDVKIDKDGTYKVGVTDFDWALDGASAFNLLFVSTDIPFDNPSSSEQCCTNIATSFSYNFVGIMLNEIPQFSL